MVPKDNPNAPRMPLPSIVVSRIAMLPENAASLQ